MKWLQNINKPLLLFLVGLFFVNLLQAYSTELLEDEAYYWVYSNFLDWGYFDHPPMVAIWITISKFFFSSGELSVRFFSTITLSVNYYLVWLLIQHPKKKEYTWLFILLVLSTALFNVYGFFTVPDTPLMLFVALFLLGYQQYLQEKSIISYLILAIAMAGMLYSKYQAVLVILFVLISNIKVLRDYKIWIAAIVALLLFLPHLYWQYENDYPSFRYHLFERASRKYRIDFTTNHFLNLIAIIGFTFPVVYTAFYKNLKNKDLFNKALTYIVWGFAIFFLLSSFKNHVQAQWILPISIPLMVITFNFLVEHQKKIKLFKILASISIGILFILRILMVNEGLIPHKFEMHGNKEWVTDLDKKIDDNTVPLFLNSYQNTATYWFYSGKRPYQFNSYWSRKNHFDLLAYNTNLDLPKATLISYEKFENSSDSILKKKKSKLFLTSLNNFNIDKGIRFSILKNILKADSENSIPVEIKNSNNFNIENLDFWVYLKNKEKSTSQLLKSRVENNSIIFNTSELKKNFIPYYIEIIGGIKNSEIHPVRLSAMEKCMFTN